jgi:hypothetical protein
VVREFQLEEVASVDPEQWISSPSVSASDGSGGAAVGEGATSIVRIDSESRSAEYLGFSGNPRKKAST